jgi:iron complex outermembrane recepter protein
MCGFKRNTTIRGDVMLTIGCRRFSVLAICLITWFSTPVVFAQTLYDFNLPPQALADTLRAIGHQTSVNILFDPRSVEKLTAPAVHGQYSASQAVNRILSGTNLAAEQTEANTLLVEPKDKAGKAQAAATLNDPPNHSQKEAGKKSSQDFRIAQVDQGNAGPQVIGDDQNSEKKKKDELTEIIVTGTHIHGTSTDSSQVIVYDRVAIEQSGAITLEDFSRQMPENFASVGTLALYSAIANGVGRDESAGNNSFAAGFNLHGLGAAQTLTLIDGHRVASGGPTAQFVDISLIPLSAIERIEVLPDGASAIYGADAVAGVVNIILRSDYDGAETGIRYGAATEGGDQQTTVSQVLGHTWSGGSALMTYEFDKQDGLRADQRDFVPINFGKGLGVTELYPEQTRNSLMLNAKQEVMPGTTLSGDAMYSERQFTQTAATPLSSQLIHTQGAPKEFGATLDLEHSFLETWHASLSPSFYRTEQPASQVILTSGLQSTESVATTIGLAQMHLHADGAIASLPGGLAKAAIGAEFRRDSFETSIQIPSYDYSVSQNLSRNVASAFTEFQVPVVGKGNAIPGIQRLDLSIAGRYDHYTTGGSAATPRVSVLWSPYADLNLHGTFARAFVAPRLDQLALGSPQYEALSLTNPDSPTGTTDTLYRSGGNPALQPERSTTYTLGADLKFSVIPGLSLSATYFNTVFRNQILAPPILNFSGVFQDPTLQPFLDLSPNKAAIAQLFNSGQVIDYTGPPPLGAAGVEAIFDDRYANLAVSRQSGVDISSAYTHDVSVGTVGVRLSGTYLIKYEAQNTSAVPATVLLNQLGEPVNLRANAILSWSLQGLSTALTVHYVNHYENPLFTPAESISSWITADLHLAYEFAGDASPALRGFGLALDVRNLLDKTPPVINLPVNNVSFPYNPGFDGANADPLGRVVSLQLRKRW